MVVEQVARVYKDYSFESPENRCADEYVRMHVAAYVTADVRHIRRRCTHETYSRIYSEYIYAAGLLLEELLISRIRFIFFSNWGGIIYIEQGLLTSAEGVHFTHTTLLTRVTQPVGISHVGRPPSFHDKAFPKPPQVGPTCRPLLPPPAAAPQAGRRRNRHRRRRFPRFPRPLRPYRTPTSPPSPRISRPQPLGSPPHPAIGAAASAIPRSTSSAVLPSNSIAGARISSHSGPPGARRRHPPVSRRCRSPSLLPRAGRAPRAAASAAAAVFAPSAAASRRRLPSLATVCARAALAITGRPA
uniref:Uncharacterized protein n=1 Tax=Oryza sativa subsp. japonica TaxID=39947 RepID=Q7F7Z6_ORYSJ|nr:unnamed protein product [Oryza sativa Japonica Group]